MNEQRWGELLAIGGALIFVAITLFALTITPHEPRWEDFVPSTITPGVSPSATITPTASLPATITPGPSPSATMTDVASTLPDTPSPLVVTLDLTTTATSTAPRNLGAVAWRSHSPLKYPAIFTTTQAATATRYYRLMDVIAADPAILATGNPATGDIDAILAMSGAIPILCLGDVSHPSGPITDTVAYSMSVAAILTRLHAVYTNDQLARIVLEVGDNEYEFGNARVLRGIVFDTIANIWGSFTGRPFKIIGPGSGRLSFGDMGVTPKIGTLYDFLLQANAHGWLKTGDGIAAHYYQEDTTSTPPGPSLSFNDSISSVDRVVAKAGYNGNNPVQLDYYYTEWGFNADPRDTRTKLEWDAAWQAARVADPSYRTGLIICKTALYGNGMTSENGGWGYISRIPQGSDARSPGFWEQTLEAPMTFPLTLPSGVPQELTGTVGAAWDGTRFLLWNKGNVSITFNIPSEVSLSQALITRTNGNSDTIVAAMGIYGTWNNGQRAQLLRRSNPVNDPVLSTINPVLLPRLTPTGGYVSLTLGLGVAYLAP